MADESQAIDKAKFAARELIAKFERYLGREIPSFMRENMLFAFETGYLRGFSDGMENGMKTSLEITRSILDRGAS
jgi:hypothetical protein